ncbi:uncharacterized protein Tco025E_08343 [Trypanosoma conorhini]|uniref:Ubiquitin-like domain-containing protein n=1 Tax=Trypanosoma conorhini TaxID=83891 RepID=A0A422NAZ0_9TRYP|nr:uncharacterized protein Tco025E_08343 [Trypanosoma conorhini]RNF02644.1 hypothetical protein Tco025E_08343 [Trypanosoma conorhini]
MHNALLCLGKRRVLLLCIVLVSAFAFVSAAAAAAEDALAQRRRERCGMLTDCVIISAPGAQLTVDELKMQEDTPDTVLARLPSWFGGQRPFTLLLNGKKLNGSATLSSQGVEVGSTLSLLSSAASVEQGEL